MSHRRRAFDAAGRRIDAPPRTTQVLGVTSYIRYFTLEAFPRLGWAFEVVVPEVSVRGGGVSRSGLGDPLVGFPGVWIKPTPDTSLGFRHLLQIPVGGREVTAHVWSSTPLVFYNLNVGRFNAGGNTGLILRAANHHDRTDPGWTLFSNLRFGYRIRKLDPFVAVDYQQTTATRDRTTGLDLPGSSSHETAIGAGLVWYFTPTLFANARYYRSVAGRNTLVGEGVSLGIAYLFGKASRRR